MVPPALRHLNPLRPPVESPFPRCAAHLSPLPGAPLPSALAPHPLLPSPPGRLPSVCLVLCTPPLSPPSITPLRAQQTDTSPTSSPRCPLSSLGVWRFALLSYHTRVPHPAPQSSGLSLLLSAALGDLPVPSAPQPQPLSWKLPLDMSGDSHSQPDRLPAVSLLVPLASAELFQGPAHLRGICGQTTELGHPTPG